MNDFRIEITDVNGSFARFTSQGGKMLRERLSHAIGLTAVALQARAEQEAPYGPEGEGADPSGHIRLELETRQRSGALFAEVGVYDPLGAEVALFNEYTPDRQPFLRPAAQQVDRLFTQNSQEAIAQLERDLSI
jgi:hypothetical protein